MNKEVETKMHAAYGRFGISFEEAILSLQYSILDYFTVQDRQKALLLLTDQNAMHLLKIWRALMLQQFSKSEIVLKRIELVYKGFESLIQKRNEIVHGTWGFHHPQMESVLLGIKSKIAKSGVV